VRTLCLVFAGFRMCLTTCWLGRLVQRRARRVFACSQTRRRATGGLGLCNGVLRTGVSELAITPRVDPSGRNGQVLVFVYLDAAESTQITQSHALADESLSSEKRPLVTVVMPPISSRQTQECKPSCNTHTISLSTTFLSLELWDSS